MFQVLSHSKIGQSFQPWKHYLTRHPKYTKFQLAQIWAVLGHWKTVRYKQYSGLIYMYMCVQYAHCGHSILNIAAISLDQKCQGIVCARTHTHAFTQLVFIFNKNSMLVMTIRWSTIRTRTVSFCWLVFDPFFLWCALPHEMNICPLKMQHINVCIVLVLGKFMSFVLFVQKLCKLYKHK